jgi:hypothetical protein
MAALADWTRRLADALREAPEDTSGIAPAELTDFERRLAALRRALDPGRRARVLVSAQGDWQRSDIDVHANDLVYLDAAGGWTMRAPSAPDDDGETPPPVEAVPLIGGLPLGAVLWRVGGGDVTHALVSGGASDAVRVAADGPLEFRINEQHVVDNTGTVTIRVLVLPSALIDALVDAGARVIGR